jgi:hypothetical protein
VVGVPGGAALAPLRDRRAGELDGVEDQEQRERRADRERQEDQRGPARLGHDDRPEVRQVRRPSGRVVPRRPQPLEGHRNAHHDVARDDDAVVEHVAVVDRGEHLGQPQRQDHDADHLHHGREPADPVVLVVRRREPAVADPRPRDREHREGEAQHAGAHVVLGDVVGELVGGLAERDHEDQVVEQLQRRGRAVRLVRVTAGQATPTVTQVRDGGVAHPPDDASGTGLS